MHKLTKDEITGVAGGKRLRVTVTKGGNTSDLIQFSEAITFADQEAFLKMSRPLVQFMKVKKGCSVSKLVE